MSIASALSLPSVGIRLSGATNRFIEAHTKLGLWSLRSSCAEWPRKAFPARDFALESELCFAQRGIQHLGVYHPNCHSRVRGSSAFWREPCSATTRTV